MIESLLTNTAYGFPRGTRRRIKPFILAVLHDTANTATPQQERTYANRIGSDGPSATHYIGSDGTIVHAVDEYAYAAWSQGDVTKPDTTNAGVKAVVAQMTGGYNANECVLLSIEVCSQAGDWTPAQWDAVAHLLADASVRSGLSIERTTVLAHRDLNTVNRPSDPWPAATREANMAKVIAAALTGGSSVIVHQSLGHVVTTTDARIYPDPSTSATPLASRVPKGSRLRLFGVVTGWRYCEVSLGGVPQLAWIRADETAPDPQTLSIVDGAAFGQADLDAASAAGYAKAKAEVAAAESARIAAEAKLLEAKAEATKIVAL